MNDYLSHLVNGCGLASTRASSLAGAMDKLHTSIGAMDSHNLAAMWRNMPGLMEAVAQYADANPGLNDYRAWRAAQ